MTTSTATADFWTVVHAARELTAEQAEILQAVYERHWDGRTERASKAAHKASQQSGRQGKNFSDDPAWQALDELCGISGGAADAALAVLVRDLIDPADFALLTRGWREVGLGLPGELVEVQPDRSGVRGWLVETLWCLPAVALFAWFVATDPRSLDTIRRLLGH